jgi:anthranilate phosphoribosyltransferase
VKKAWVLRSEDGLDEVSPAAPTRISELGPDGQVRERSIAPEDFGVPRTSLSGLAGGEAADNAKAVETILDGKPHPALEAVVLNAAAALCVASGDAPLECAAKVRSVLENQTARQTFDRWKRAAVRARQA